MPRKLKIASTTLFTIASNISAAFPESILRAYASLFNLFRKVHSPHFFEVHSPFDGDKLETAGVSPPAKTLVVANEIFELFIKRAASIDTILIIW